MRRFLSLCFVSLTCVLTSKADLLLGTLSWAMHGTADSGPGEICQIGFAYPVEHDASIAVYTPCGPTLAGSDRFIDLVVARLTNGQDERLLFGAALSTTSGTIVDTLESAIPKEPGVAGPDFAGYRISRLVSSTQITNQQLLGCEPNGTCSGPSEFDAIGRWQFFGDIAAVPEAGEYSMLVGALLLLGISARRRPASALE